MYLGKYYIINIGFISKTLKFLFLSLSTSVAYFPALKLENSEKGMKLNDLSIF